MNCISPIMVTNDGRRDSVPCGRCSFCLEAKRTDWSIRLQNELKYSDTAYFLTMTYDDANLLYGDSWLPSLNKRDCQLFMKKLRKENVAKIRYYMVGEYGTKTCRPHYHAIVYNVEDKVISKVDRIWAKGHTKVGSVTPQSIHYVTKYCINRVGQYEGREKPFALMSRRPGLGYRYIETHAKWHSEGLRGYTKINGVIARMPRYYKDKIFNKRQKELIAKANIEMSDEEYFKEMKRLEKFHDDPFNYLEEKIRYQHDTVKEKVNKLNTF